MTRDRFDLLLLHCADLGVDVDWADLGHYRRGEYRDDQLLIRLNTRLTSCQATATLAHECGHAVFRDRCSSPRNERRAWEYGASLIIEPWEYADAESLVGPHAGALADALEVTPKLIEAWRRWYLKRYPVERSVLADLDALEVDQPRCGRRLDRHSVDD